MEDDHSSFMAALGREATARGYMPSNLSDVEALAAEQQSSQSGSCVLAIGTAVTIQNLRSRPDLNGCNGRVVGAFSSSSGRCGVLIEGEPGAKSLRPDNLVVPSQPSSPP